MFQGLGFDYRSRSCLNGLCSINTASLNHRVPVLDAYMFTFVAWVNGRSY